MTSSTPEPTARRRAAPRSKPAANDLSARDRILAAAEKLFAEGGFDKTSTARIAAAAGVPHGLVFYHFKTKMDLLLAIVQDDEITALDELLPGLEPTGDPRQAVIDVWTCMSTALGQPSQLRRIVMQELAAHEEIRLRAAALQDQIATLVGRHLARLTGPTADPSADPGAEPVEPVEPTGPTGPTRPAEPLPQHLVAARLLATYAAMNPLLGEAGQRRIDAGTLADLLADGLSREACLPHGSQ